MAREEALANRRTFCKEPVTGSGPKGAAACVASYRERFPEFPEELGEAPPVNGLDHLGSGAGSSKSSQISSSGTGSGPSGISWGFLSFHGPPMVIPALTMVTSEIRVKLILGDPQTPIRLPGSTRQEIGWASQLDRLPTFRILLGDPCSFAGSRGDQAGSLVRRDFR